MIRAASIPHLGQTTPTAALGLRAMPSLLTRLDAGWPLTVRCMPLISARRGICPEVSGIESFLASKLPSFPTVRDTMQETPPSRDATRESAYICEYDAQGADISVTCFSGLLGACATLFDTLVGQLPVIYAIVGNAAPRQPCHAREYRKTGPKTKKSENRWAWYAHCFGFVREESHEPESESAQPRAK